MEKNLEQKRREKREREMKGTKENRQEKKGMEKKAATSAFAKSFRQIQNYQRVGSLAFGNGAK